MAFTMIAGLFVSCKSTKVPPEEMVYNKIVHPREYYFDLSQYDEKLRFRKNKETGLLTATADFTDIVKDDIPQAGDKLIFYYKGYTTKDVKGTIKAALEIPMTFSLEREIVLNPLKKFEIEGQFTYVLQSNLEKVVLTFYIDKPQEYSRVDFINEPTEKPVTDLKAEEKAEKKAIHKKFTINEVRVPIVDEYSNKPLSTPVKKGDSKAAPGTDNKSSATEPKPVEKTPEEIAAEEKAKKAEEERIALEKRKEAERLEFEKQQQELKDHQKKLEETIQTITNTDIKRYEKEYLNDYVITEYDFEDQLQEQEKPKENHITNPNQKDNFDRTLLMKAAQEGNDWQIKALLNANADVNLKDKDGWTALMYAVRYQENMSCVELLLNAGADVKATNNFGMSALLLAANYNNNPEILKKLLSYYSPTDKDVLKSFILVLTENTATEYMQVIKVNLFLDLSVPLNSFYEGKTPIMYAAESGNSTKVIKLLLDSNSITSIRSTEGKTAFDYAKENPKLKHDNIYWSLNNK